jgi:hypothetical protein
MPSYKLIVNNAKVILKTMANYVINLTGIKDNLTGTGNVTNGKIDWTLQEFTNTSSWFTTNNPVLLLGQKGIETDDLLTAPKFKIGDGVTVWNSLPYFSSGSSTTPTLQEVINESAVVIGTVYSSPDTNSNVFFQNERHQVTISDGTDQIVIEQSPTSFNKNGVEILTLDGGNLTGLLGEAKSSNIASDSTTDLSTATGNLVHITGSTTINSFGTLPAGVKINLVFDAAPIITNSANIICPGNVSINAAANDTAIIVSEGGGVWRFLTFWKYDESYTNYTPSFTGFSVAPTITAGDWRWKMLTKNTFHLIGWGTAAGTSNSTGFTFTAPFTLAWTGGSGFGLQQTPCVVVNNGSQVIGTVRSKTGGSNILDVFTAASGVFTASGNKTVYVNAVFQMEI